MPIKFRCPNCHQFLGISRAKAGEISDCPMCGKTVRVPDLDGTVRPLPKPELNLEDSDLVDALGELASIGVDQISGRAQLSSHASKPATMPSKVPAAEPVQLEPLEPALPVIVAEPPRPARPSLTAGAARKSHSSAALSEGTLADDLPVPSGRQPSRPSARTQSRRGRTPVWSAAAIIAGLLLIGSAVLLLINRNNTAPAVADQNAGQGETSEEAVAPPDAERVAAAAPALTGRITYVSEAGDTRPDAGARVIVLPAQRRGTIKFDAAGFMAGSGEVDAAVAAAGLRALGGDLAVADEQGQYAVTLSDAGSYELLVISRHQSRPWEVGVEAPTQEMLERFFIRPSTLLGQLAYVVQPLHYRGQGTSPRDFAFERQ